MNPIIEKIKKLMALAKNEASNPNEAASAMQKAISLAAEHGIDLSSIPTDATGEPLLTHVSEPSQAGLPHRLSSGIVKRAFGVDTLFDSTRKQAVIHFIGKAENCELARYCYIYLVRTMRAAWRNRKNRRLRDRESFLRGFAQAIDSQMAVTFHLQGLIVSSEAYVQNVILAHAPRAKVSSFALSKKKISDASFSNGYRDGKNTGIRNPIPGTSTPLLS
ncbi:MAG: DUF2786 domain-containing protein [Luteolibacter sp.]